MLSIITSESVVNSELHAERCSFYSLIRSELVGSVNLALSNLFMERITHVFFI